MGRGGERSSRDTRYLLALFSGVLADRISRRLMLIWSSLIFALLGLLTAVMISADLIELLHLFVLAFLIAVAQTFGVTAGQTLIIDVVDRNVDIRDGYLYPPEGPGLGTALKPEVLDRPDAVVMVSDEAAG